MTGSRPQRQYGAGRKKGVRRSSMRLLKKSWVCYLFILPMIIYIVLFNYLPMYGIQLAFKDYRALDGIWGSPWVGWKHFQTFFGSYQFKDLLWNTLALSIYSLAAGFLASDGIVNQILALLGIEPVAFLSNPKNFRHIYVWSGVLQSIGWGSIMYISVLASVGPELHEAARVDGATKFQRMLYIDIPSIVPTMVIMLIMRAGEIMDVGFEKAFLLQNSVNLDYSEIISTYVYKIGIQSGQFSYSAAIGLFNNIINLILLLAVNRIAGKTSDVSLW